MNEMKFLNQSISLLVEEKFSFLVKKLKYTFSKKEESQGLQKFIYQNDGNKVIIGYEPFDIWVDAYIFIDKNKHSKYRIEENTAGEKLAKTNEFKFDQKLFGQHIEDVKKFLDKVSNEIFLEIWKA